MMRFTPCQGKPSTSSLLMQPPVHYFAPALPAQFQTTTFSPRSNIAQELDLFRSGQDPAVTAARIQQVGHNFHCRRCRLHRTMRIFNPGTGTNNFPLSPHLQLQQQLGFSAPQAPSSSVAPLQLSLASSSALAAAVQAQAPHARLGPCPPLPFDIQPNPHGPNNHSTSFMENADAQVHHYITTSTWHKQQA